MQQLSRGSVRETVQQMRNVWFDLLEPLSPYMVGLKRWAFHQDLPSGVVTFTKLEEGLTVQVTVQCQASSTPAAATGAAADQGLSDTVEAMHNHVLSTVDPAAFGPNLPARLQQACHLRDTLLFFGECHMCAGCHDQKYREYIEYHTDTWYGRQAGAAAETGSAAAAAAEPAAPALTWGCSSSTSRFWQLQGLGKRHQQQQAQMLLLLLRLLPPMLQQPAPSVQPKSSSQWWRRCSESAGVCCCQKQTVARS